MWGAPSSAGWRHSATTCRRRSLQPSLQVTSLPLRAKNQRAFEISFFEQRPVVRIA